MHTRNLPEIVRTQGHMQHTDGAGMTYRLQKAKPASVLGNVSVPTIDGRWAVPMNFPVAPNGEFNAESTNDALKRAHTFAAAGKKLIWDPTRPSPLELDIVHSTQSAPYGLTCSQFVGMVLAGYDFEHTTYVNDENNVVGDYVNYGKPTAEFTWQAWRLAKWFKTNPEQGDIWLNDPSNPHYQPGDILFFSQQNPEGNDTTGKYYGNIFHTGIYLGNGRIIQSYSKDTPSGVVVEDISKYLNSTLSFVARPKYTHFVAPATNKVTSGDEKVSGVAQPNIEIVVVFPDGSKNSTTSDASGLFTVSVPNTVVLSSGQTIHVYSINAAKNRSVPTPVTIQAKLTTTTKLTTKLTTKSTTKPTTKRTTKVTTKLTTKETTKSTSKPTTKATTKLTTKQTTKATTKPSMKTEAVYRLYHAGIKRHLYTKSRYEAQVLSGRGWRFEGEKFQTATKGIPVYRLYHSGTREYLYTTNINERDTLKTRGWRYEGIAWYSTGKKPIYRLYHAGLKVHLYTADVNEKNTLIKRGWKYEGISFYVNQ